MGEGKRALAHGYIRRQHTALGDDRRPVTGAAASMGKGPEGAIVEIVDKSIAIGPNQSHIAHRILQLLFQLLPASLKPAV